MLMNCFMLFSQTLSMKVSQCKNCLGLVENTVSHSFCSGECDSNYQHVLDRE